jgi:6-pyruvoyltetrahydropterin/6-carboxytetrahydropterin synthase
VLTLTRTIRFSLTRDIPPGDALASPRGNTHAGWPSMNLVAGASWEATVEVRGNPDPRTGYLVGIDKLDHAVRTRALPVLLEAHRHRDLSPVEVARIILETASGDGGPTFDAIEVGMERDTRWRVDSGDMSVILIQRRYEFSASHRLHLAELDDEANAAMFGKCSNPNGHGHNYEVEVQVRTNGDAPVSILALDQVVDDVVIDRFDHKHLNLDLDDFNDRVPSVENIAARCVDLLRDPVAAIPGDCRLHGVKVWETPRTACTVLA